MIFVEIISIIVGEGGDGLPRLEYRLLDPERNYPVLYYYNGMDKEEITLRFACDYFVKDQHVYEKMSCALENGTYVIYVRRAEDEQVLDSPAGLCTGLEGNPHGGAPLSGRNGPLSGGAHFSFSQR